LLQAGLYASKVITTMDSDRLKVFAGETHLAFLEELSVFLNCKVVECKMHARKSLQYTRKTIGVRSLQHLNVHLIEDTILTALSSSRAP
jgi:hypothetical protein